MRQLPDVTRPSGAGYVARMRISSVPLAIVLVACGGGAPPPTNATSATVSATSTSAAAPIASGAAPTASVAASEPADADPNESSAPIAMVPLFTKSTPKSSFPKKTVGDKECWQGSELSGDAAKDYAMLVGKCGAPTGSLEYAKAVVGHLHHVKDKRDTFMLKLLGGYCYRYFAVADSTIKDLDILVEKNNALVADDKTTSPVAIVESDKQWCQDVDVEYSFHIEVDGEGRGNYLFGVWARPK